MKEYIPVQIDMEDMMQSVLSTRPDNSTLIIEPNPKTVLDITLNGLQYQMAWERWQIYAETLEEVLRDINKVIGIKKEE